MDALRFAVLGLGAGAIYGLSALGIVLVYRGSGVLNFAHGAIGMTSAFTFYDLKDTAGWPIWAALVVAISVAAFIGAATHLLVMRHLRDASGLARLIASLGVLTLLHGIAGEVWSFNYRVPTRILPDGVVELLSDAAIGVDRLILLGIALTLTAVLWSSTATRSSAWPPPPWRRTRGRRRRRGSRPTSSPRSTGRSEASSPERPPSSSSRSAASTSRT